MKTRDLLIEKLNNKEDEIYSLIEEMVENSHKSKNCHRLYVHTNGDLWIGEEVSDNSWAVIPGTNIPIAFLVKVYNSCGCNCDWCNDPEYIFSIYDFSEAIEFTIEEALQNVKDIEEGYFDDENQEDN